MRKLLSYLIYAAAFAAPFAVRPHPYVVLVAALTSMLWYPPIHNYCLIERPLVPEFDVCGTGDVVLSPKLADYFASIQAALSGRGFHSFPVYRTNAGARVRVDEFVQVHESPSTGDVAITVGTVSARQVLSMLEFRTRLRSDRELRTSNRPVPALDAQDGVSLNRLPLETDPLKLYDAHRATIESLRNERVMGRPLGDPVAFLTADYQRETESEVRHGLSVVDRRANTVRPTFRKAFRLAYRRGVPASRVKLLTPPKDTTPLISPRPNERPMSRAVFVMRSIAYVLLGTLAIPGAWYIGMQLNQHSGWEHAFAGKVPLLALLVLLPRFHPAWASSQQPKANRPLVIATCITWMIGFGSVGVWVLARPHGHFAGFSPIFILAPLVGAGFGVISIAGAAMVWNGQQYLWRKLRLRNGNRRALSSPAAR